MPKWYLLERPVLNPYTAFSQGVTPSCVWWALGSGEMLGLFRLLQPSSQEVIGGPCSLGFELALSTEEQVD